MSPTTRSLPSTDLSCEDQVRITDIGELSGYAYELMSRQSQIYPCYGSTSGGTRSTYVEDPLVRGANPVRLLSLHHHPVIRTLYIL
jgi:hypothetical protein